MLGISGGSGRSVRGFRASGFGLAMVMLVGLQGIGAQEAVLSANTKVDDTLQGQVVNAKTGAPLVGAFIHVEGNELGVLTGAKGTFTLKNVGSGTTNLVVEELGYVTLQQSLEVKDPRKPVVLRVDPDPTLLDGVNVVLDRLEQRRNATATSSWAFDRADLVSIPNVDALSFLEARAPVQLFSCYMGSECAIVHGQVVPVSVYVDEMPFIGGIDYLRVHQPYELERIEVYAGGRQIRVYTQAFLARAGKARLQPSPFIL